MKLTTLYGKQVTILPTRPRAERIQRVRNPPLFRGGDISTWMLRGPETYRGNKPFGGFWTSSYTPQDEYLCDWQRGTATNQAVKIGAPHRQDDKSWLLTPTMTSRVMPIQSFADAQEFTQEFSLGVLPIPLWMRGGFGVLLTATLSDWERALRQCDGIWLSAEACDEISFNKMHGGEDTAFDAWNTESTLWGAWAFQEVQPL